MMASTSSVAIPGDLNPQASIDAWDIAKARFLEGLCEADKAIFNEATPENLYYSTSSVQMKDATESKIRSSLQKIQPLVNAVEDYGKALDAFSNIASLYLAPIWGSLRVILVLASSYNKFFNRLVDTLGRIGDILPRFRDYQRLFGGEKHSRFTQTVSAAYLDIIILCTEFRAALQNQKKSAARRIFKPLSPVLNTQLEEAIARFRQHRKSVEKEAEICHMIEEKEMRDLVKRNNEVAEARQREEKQRRLLEKLTKTDYEYKHRRMQRIRHPGTGDWFTEMLDFKKWRETKSSAVMCCYGMPGCGKSVLLSSLIDVMCSDTLHSKEKLGIAYFYCDYSDKRTLDIVNIFSSMALQLLKSLGELPASIISILEDICQETKTVELEKLLDLNTIVLERFSKILLFVDGLDELNDNNRKLAFNSLTGFTQLSTQVKILVSSRGDMTSLIRSPKFPVFKILMGANSIATDIECYVKHTVRNLVRKGDLVLGNSELEENIITALIQGAKGMFLWVKFQLDDICNAITDDAIRKVLQHLPRDLAETYSRLLGRIEGAEMREHVKRMFNWIICSKQPLQVDELREGIAFTIDDQHWEAEKIPNDINRLIRNCGNLVVVDEETQDVRFAHYSVQQYLLDLEKPDPTVFHTTREEADIALGEVCIAYLSFTDFETQVTQYHPDYATQGLKTIESAVRSGSILPSNSKSESIARILVRLRSRGDTTSSHVSFARVLDTVKTQQQTMPLIEKYTLLSYVTEHWLSHTKSFPKLDDKDGTIEVRYLLKRTKMFDHLAFDKKLLLNFRPWDEVLIKNQLLPYALQAGWAISENHSPLLRCLIERHGNLYNFFHPYLMTAIDAYLYAKEIFNFKDFLWINSNHWPNILCFDLGSVEAFPLSRNWALWFYERIFHAVKKGWNETIITFLDYSSIISSNAFQNRFFVPHMLLACALYGQRVIARKLRAILESWPLKNESNIWITTGIPTEHGEIICNAADLAAFFGFEDTMNILISAGCRISSTFQASIVKNHSFWRQIVESSDKRRLLCLLKHFSATKDSFDCLVESLSSARPASSVLPAVIDHILCKIIRGESITLYSDRWILAIEDHDQRINLLIALGGKPTLEDGQLLLWHAIGEGDHFRVKLLLLSGVPFVGKESYFYVEDYSMFEGTKNFYGTILEYRNRQPFLKDLRHISPLVWAVLNQQFDIITSMIENTLLPREQIAGFSSNLGFGPLHFAIISGSSDIFSLLVRDGFPIDTSVQVGTNICDLEYFNSRYCSDPKTQALIYTCLENRIKEKRRKEQAWREEEAEEGNAFLKAYQENKKRRRKEQSWKD